MKREPVRPGGFGTRPNRPNRRSIRLKGYDYSRPGAYFITIVTQDRACLLGRVVEGRMQLNAMGRMVEFTWFDLPNHVHGLVLDAFVVMPNHVHGIVIITDPSMVVGAGSEPAPTEPAPTAKKRHGLPEIVRQFKTFSARRVNEYRQTPDVPLWQRNYYEHIIRDDESLNRIREYIANNPLQWEFDRENPGFTGPMHDIVGAQRRCALSKDEPWRI